MSSGLILAGRYHLQEQLGVGGMGSVWRAFDQNLGADVAIKLIDSSLTSSPDALERFRREARAAATIRSTYVVQILDYGIDQETPFIAMELLRGESLAHRLEVVQKLGPEETGHLLGHVGRALALAHEHGIVHRDLKPENIFLVREGREDVGKVLDFGIARHSGLAEQSTVKTQAGTILGTPYYMSPEQASGQPVDHQSDIWAFGIIAYECLVGRRAVDGDSLGAIFHAVCMAPLPVPSQIDNVPEGFDEWFQRAVARDKGCRFDSIRQAAEELHTICGCTSSRTLVLNLTRPSGVSPVATRTVSVPQNVPQSRVALPQSAGAVPSSPLAEPAPAPKFDIGSSATLAIGGSTQTIREPASRNSWRTVGLAAALAITGTALFWGWQVSRQKAIAAIPAQASSVATESMARVTVPAPTNAGHATTDVPSNLGANGSSLPNVATQASSPSTGTSDPAADTRPAASAIAVPTGTLPGGLLPRTAALGRSRVPARTTPPSAAVGRAKPSPRVRNVAGF